MTELDRHGPHVVLLATGGTISSRQEPSGEATLAADTGEQLLDSIQSRLPFPVRVVDVFRRGSYLLTFDDMLAVCASIRSALSDPNVVGVVVAHGTDTMEETAYLADLLHDDSRPVVFTGSQRAADDNDPDGPENLAHAIVVASSPAAANRGVLLSFGGDIFAIPGVRKAHTVDARAFSNPDRGSLGFVCEARDLVLADRIQRPEPLPWPATDHAGETRVDLVAVYPGADALHIDASVDAGARGIVLGATGTGNANVAVGEATVRATGAGVVVVTSTRVHAGPVVPVYGAGGGRDLLRSGAIPSGLLKPSQSLILLSLLLRLGSTDEQIREAFADRGAFSEPDPLTSPTAHITPLKG